MTTSIFTCARLKGIDIRRMKTPLNRIQNHIQNLTEFYKPVLLCKLDWGVSSLMISFYLLWARQMNLEPSRHVMSGVGRVGGTRLSFVGSRGPT